MIQMSLRILALTFALGTAAEAQQYVYPAKGQSPAPPQAR